MESAFTKIGSYLYSSEAIIIKGKLASEGIEVFMADNHTIETDPLMSNAIGGVKLFVKTEQLGAAKKVLDEISRYSLDDKGKPIKCPKCQQNKVEIGSTVKNIKSFFVFLFSFGFLGTLPFYIKYKYRCSNCGNEFNIS
ncbi:DUF2007 domain-containing protein [Flavobacterium litorale]|uniref:DUF2007 domain-containing protein n=1 Tax=Flavobacterium litorale TaxID=2856519 RepID=A0ABX8VAN3_9FLAO|nr:DUF2007 domain-containing protein [Flavobacterium litorale]QYJ69173.1 DUF2007 domain-containing protein [Flavobacterium litorale]